MVLGLRSLSAILHPSNEPGKLPQWLCHDDNTINIVVLTLIITITYSRVLQPKYINTTQYGQNTHEADSQDVSTVEHSHGNINRLYGKKCQNVYTLQNTNTQPT